MKRNNTFGFVRAKAEGESRKVIFTASTSAKDRHGTILNQENWDLENFNRNGIIGYNHEVYGSMFGGSDPDDVIGRGRAFVEEGELRVEIDFEPAEINEKADKIFKKVMHGTLNAVSVGFSPLGEGEFGKGEEARGADNETYYFKGQELLEVSVVNIPSNSEAVKKSLNQSAIKYILDNSKDLSTEDRLALKLAISDVKDFRDGGIVNDNTNTEDVSSLLEETNKKISDVFDKVGKEIVRDLKESHNGYEYRKRKLKLKLKK